MAKLYVTSFLIFLVTAWTVNAKVDGLPNIDLHEWWGPKNLKCKANTAIRPHEIRFSPEMVKDLRSRLKNHRKFTPPLEGAAFEWGFNTNAIEPWVKFWAEHYDFEEREAYFNSLPQYKTNIQGLDIHFVRVQPEVISNVTVVPLMLLHGADGSFREFYEASLLFTKLTKGQDFVFEVIMPSYPGFGYSDHASRPGMGPVQVGTILNNLMKRLGYEQYYIAASGWGSIIATTMATLFQKEVMGLHSALHVVLNKYLETNTLLGAISAVQGALGTETIEAVMAETGFLHLQATKPDSLGILLTESPVSLLTYILEKFSVYTGLGNRYLSDGGLYNHYTKTQLIDNVMVYWSSNSIGHSMRLYAEAFTKKQRALKINEYSTSVPLWILHTVNDFLSEPLNHLKFKNILGVTNLNKGGQCYLAYELPEVYVADVYKAVKVFNEFHDKKN